MIRIAESSSDQGRQTDRKCAILLAACLRTYVRLASEAVEKRKHYWNSRWGRLARMDILVYEDAGTWTVEARHGGADGKSRWFELPNEDIVLDCVRDLIPVSGFDGWREL
jgi:hypothetical protein